MAVATAIATGSRIQLLQLPCYLFAIVCMGFAAATNTNSLSHSVSVSVSGALHPDSSRAKGATSDPYYAQQLLMRRRDTQAPSLVEIESGAESAENWGVSWRLYDNKEVVGNDLAMWAHGYTGEDQSAAETWKSQSSFYYQPGNLESCKQYCLHDSNCGAFEDHNGENPPFCIFKGNASNITTQNGGKPVNVHVPTIVWEKIVGKDISNNPYASKVMAEMYRSDNVGSAVGEWGKDGCEYYHNAGDVSECEAHCRNTNTCVAFVDWTNTDPPHCVFHSTSAADRMVNAIANATTYKMA